MTLQRFLQGKMEGVHSTATGSSYPSSQPQTSQPSPCSAPNVLHPPRSFSGRSNKIYTIIRPNNWPSGTLPAGGRTPIVRYVLRGTPPETKKPKEEKLTRRHRVKPTIDHGAWGLKKTLGLFKRGDQQDAQGGYRSSRREQSPGPGLLRTFGAYHVSILSK